MDNAERKFRDLRNRIRTGLEPQEWIELNRLGTRLKKQSRRQEPSQRTHTGRGKPTGLVVIPNRNPKTQAQIRQEVTL